MIPAKKIGIFVLLFVGCLNGFAGNRIPVIVITDLYQPAQDIGDNFDLITPYALSEIDLKGVILDVTEKFRKETMIDGTSFRDPGFICVEQLNYIFNRNIPVACSPFTPMRSEYDQMRDISPYQQQGLDLFFNILKKSKGKVQVVSTGSARLLAVALNRNSRLLKKKIEKIHFCAGSSSNAFREWNIELDTLAAYRLLKSNLPISVYPCATQKGPFDRGQYNTFWMLDDLSFIRQMDRKLQNYLIFAFLRKNSTGFFNYMDVPIPKVDADLMESGFYRKKPAKHYVWETAVWMQVAGRVLVMHKDGRMEIINRKNVIPDDVVSEEKMKPCYISISRSGLFSFSCSNEKTNFSIYYREHPDQNELWLRSALPALYLSYNTNY